MQDALDDPVIVRLVPYDADDVAYEGDGGFHHRRLAGVQSRREEQRQREGARQERRDPDCCGAVVAVDEIGDEALQEGALIEDAHGLEVWDKEKHDCLVKRKMQAGSCF